MDTIKSNVYLYGKELFSSENINFQFNNSAFLLYEVIRSIDGILLFYEDHFERLKQGASNYGLEGYLDKVELKSGLLKLLKHNNFRNGNIKVLFSSKDTPESLAAYYIPHSYPQEEAYKIGVDLLTIKLERPQPQIKQIGVNNLINKKIIKENKNTAAYEFLLVNHKNCITEGSKSNFFLVNDDSLYSAPPDSILSGITRKYVLKIAKDKGIRVAYKEIKVKDLKNYKACFICGTSPKILPVKRIDNIAYDVNNKIIDLIKNEYNSIIEEYILKFKNQLTLE